MESARLPFPELKHSAGPMRERLEAGGADRVAFTAWDESVREPLARHLAESGELADGAAVAPAVDRFYVK